MIQTENGLNLIRIIGIFFIGKTGPRKNNPNPSL
jgi:hypothetical protein